MTIDNAETTEHEPQANPELRPNDRALWALLGSVIGGLVVWLLSSRQLHVIPVGLEYTDLAAIALASVTVVLAALALGIGAAAIWGYRAFMKIAAATARKEAGLAARNEIANQIKKNEIYDEFVVQARVAANQVITTDLMARIMRERFDDFDIGDDKNAEMDRQEDMIANAEGAANAVRDGK